MTTYRVGGAARLFVEVDDEAALGQVAAAVAAVPDAADLALLVVGKGSNLLVHDDGFPGLAIRLGDGFATMAIDGREVRAGRRRGPPRAGPPDGRRRAHGLGVGGRRPGIGRRRRPHERRRARLRHGGHPHARSAS